jgi:hypothetical protein
MNKLYMDTKFAFIFLITPVMVPVVQVVFKDSIVTE